MIMLMKMTIRMTTMLIVIVNKENYNGTYKETTGRIGACS